MTDDTDVSALTDEQLAALMQDQPAPEPEPVVAEAAPEPVAETPADAPKEAKHVPLAELLEERGRRKEAQARMEEMERRFAEFQARTQQYLAQAQQAPPQPEQPPVAYNDDPIEYLRRQQEAVAQNLQMLQQQQAEMVQRQQAERQWSAMRTTVGQAEAEFAKAQPDYYDAVNYLKEQRKAQLLQAGAPPAQVDALIARDAIAVANEAASLAMSPAEYAYRIAIGKGYAPKAAQKAAEAAAVVGEAPKSLGGASGRAEPQVPSLKDVSKMSDAEFNKLFDKLMTGT